MSFKDFFKRKKEPESIKEEPSSSKATEGQEKDASSEALVKEEKKKTVKEAEKVSKKTVKDSKKTDEGLAYRILKAPHITEKSTNLVKNNKYVFKVYKRSNKPEIRKAVEKLYNVDVLNVKIIKVGPKKRIFKGIKGERKGYKKAVVEIKKGQKIEIFSR